MIFIIYDGKLGTIELEFASENVFCCFRIANAYAGYPRCIIMPEEYT